MSMKIAKALHNVMTKVGYVQKSSENKFHGYKYASEAALLDKLRPAMIEEGLMLIPSVMDVGKIDDHGNTTVMIAYTLVHESGETWPDKIMAAGCGNDRNKNGIGDKGLYKAITGANKYLLFKLFQIETGDDPEATEAHPLVEAQKVKPIVTKSEFKITDEDLTLYVQVQTTAIGMAETSEQVREFWKQEATNRITYGITPGTSSYDNIKGMCETRVLQLSKDKK